MGTEVATVGATSIVNPGTGELLDLSTAESAEIAEVVEAIRDWESSARAAKLLASEELHKRMDAQAKWTLRDGPYEIRGQSPDRSEYDVDELYASLLALVTENVIAPGAAEEAVERVVTLKARKRGIGALLKLGGRVAEAIRAAEREDTRPRRIQIGKASTS